MNNIVVNNLIKLMKEQGITAYKLTKDLEMSSSTVTEWTNGKASPNRKTLMKLCDYFGVPISYFYQDSELQTLCGKLNSEEQKEVVQFIYNQFPRLNK